MVEDTFWQSGRSVLRLAASQHSTPTTNPLFGYFYEGNSNARLLIDRAEKSLREIRSRTKYRYDNEQYDHGSRHPHFPRPAWWTLPRWVSIVDARMRNRPIRQESAGGRRAQSGVVRGGGRGKRGNDQVARDSRTSGLGTLLL